MALIHPHGLAWLVELRKDALLARDPYLLPLAECLQKKFADWFCLGTLDLKRICWVSTPASVLEKIMQYEAVHAIPSWTALKQRLDEPDRYCWAFFHPNMHGEPLAFVQVAICPESPSDIRLLLDQHHQHHPQHNGAGMRNTAVFYSITQSKKGLSGIDMGSFLSTFRRLTHLVKQVMQEIGSLLPRVDRFCTLSPIPNFKIWLETHVRSQLQSSQAPPFLMTRLEESQLMALPADSTTPPDPVDKLLYYLDRSRLFLPHVEPVLKPVLTRLCAHYILKEKRRKMAVDPVCNFHVRNGASVHRINWNADPSPKGWTQSYGMMINYSYDRTKLEENNQQYLFDGTIDVVQPLDPSIQLDEIPVAKL
ncbi:hypothetical protein HDU91_006336 [Kappamyces sp. JEL0680]|nr:hypothetical protein HDU91_006336 [Kappamyces sp. JEL0680]